MAATPSRLGPYQILGPLGEGGMGQVYRARDPRIGREVAIKVLPGELAHDPERLRRFEHEARAAGALNHPNILTVYDLGSDGGAPYLVTELLEGETLRERLGRGPLPLARALEWAAQIARGLSAAHSKGIVHRDLKPENLIITRDGRAKILDFGLARWGAGSAPSLGTTLTMTEAGATLGTVGYMAPEQVRGERADHRSDVFSFGCVAYEMLSGERAFPGAVAVQVMSAILEEDPKPLRELRPEVPASLAALVGRCLEKDPEHRFQSARDLAFAVENASAGTSGAARAATAVRAPSTSRLVTLLVAAALVGALGGVFLLPHFGRSHPPEFRRLTFRRGSITTARFTPDGNTVVYSASWQGLPMEIYLTSPGQPESRSLDLPGCELLAVSSRGELAIRRPSGALARVPLAGGAPRDLLVGVSGADWAPDGGDLAVIAAPGNTGGDASQPDSTWRLEYPVGNLLIQSAKELALPRVSPDGKWVAFVERTVPGDTGGSLVVVDRRGVRRTVTPWWVSLEDIAWMADSREIWFTAYGNGEAAHIHAVSLSGKSRVVHRSAGGIAIKDVARDGRVLATRYDLRVETYGRRDERDPERDLSVFDMSVASDVSGDGRTVLLLEQGEAAGGRYASYLRPIGGGPPVKLFEGLGTTISADGRWVLALSQDRKPPLTVQPIGAGASRRLDPGPILTYDWANWFPDGRSIVIAGFERDGLSRCYVQSLSGGPPRAFTPPRTNLYNPGAAVSPNGQAIVVRDLTDGSAWLYPVGGEAKRRVVSIGPLEFPMRWSADGRYLYAFTAITGRIYRHDLATGQRALWSAPHPGDSAGIRYLGPVIPTQDGRGYVYTLTRGLTDLYLIERLR